MGGRKVWVKAVAYGSTIGTTLAILVGGGYFLGKFLDLKWGTYPVFTLVSMIGGLIFGGSSVVYTLKNLSKMDNDKR